MLIKVDDIREIRQIAKNIDPERVEIYIREAETIDILPRVGAEFYQRLTQIGDIEYEACEILLKEEIFSRETIEMHKDLPVLEWKFLTGGYYLGSDGSMRHFDGAKSALCYYSYARLVRNHSSQVTPFGVVTKMGDESSLVDIKSIAVISSDARKIGDEYLSQCLEFLNDMRDAKNCEKKGSGQRRKFIAIGD